MFTDEDSFPSWGSHDQIYQNWSRIYSEDAPHTGPYSGVGGVSIRPPPGPPPPQHFYGQCPPST